MKHRASTETPRRQSGDDEQPHDNAENCAKVNRKVSSRGAHVKYFGPKHTETGDHEIQKRAECKQRHGAEIAVTAQ